jgi:tripartite-type tricarboxylate transporter receptor subunit TctC
MSSRGFATAVVAAAALTSLAAYAQGPADAYPAKPVRVVIGLAPGGGTDIQARLFAQKLSENMGRPFVVENRTGAGGTIAYALTAKSPPDGYTLLGVTSGYTITPAVYSKLPYDPVKDFAPISLVVQAPFLLLTHPSLPVRSVKELLALARAKPSMLDCGSAGHGSSTHMAFELFRTGRWNGRPGAHAVRQCPVFTDSCEGWQAAGAGSDHGATLQGAARLANHH